MRSLFVLTVLIVFASCKKNVEAQLPSLNNGWANNSINTTIFRKNSLITYDDQQYISFYDNDARVILGQRTSANSTWQLAKTQYGGNAFDAHNSINIIADGDGYLHMAWNNHNTKLNYCKSIAPGSLELSNTISMTGKFEQNVTYPEFYKINDGDLLFLYRNGESGRGNLVVNYYGTKTKSWSQVQNNLISGEGARSAYWQAFVDDENNIHISWVWRETGDVSTNHDLCYAVSKDGGKTWQKSNGDKYKIPITQATAEYAAHIPQNSELINQTSMCADANGAPYIATYWKDKNETVPQYHIVYLKNNNWQNVSLPFRKQGFKLNGYGTKMIPISRPQIILWQQNVGIIFRDNERNNKVSLAFFEDIDSGIYHITDIFNEDMGAWEPTYDTELWKTSKRLNLFMQHVVQLDSEGKANVKPQLVSVFEWTP